ncbi:hypothetical protein BJF79_31055 [Actinomadura sp. CNU-125]|uniref:DUF3592 domain-containing protein n=1 Tax=Actinomadura sp. CNU-125 TaxID=1904961 RepID=UPI00096242FA|nr:DUF3592 domain-containing protein [Actinomadura sp. CNU-125]OLT36529.1 hypothetical protein BJF79_31055 [Actinomadura sp. CNU-125]
MTTTTASALALLGPCLIAMALPMLLKWRRLIPRGKSVTGVLIDPRELPAPDSPGFRAALENYRRELHPSRAVFRFTTEDGREVVGRSTVRTGAGPGNVGDRVIVHYDPADPKKADLTQAVRVERTFGSLIAAAGTALLIIGVIGVLTGE